MTMDPNVALANMRQLVEELDAWVESGEDPDEPGEYYRIASELSAHFDGLDGWLSEGGFPPDAWIKHHTDDANELHYRIARLRKALVAAGVAPELVRKIELDKP